MSTSSTLKLALELAAKVTGREDLAALAGEVEELGPLSTETAAETERLAQTLEGLTQQRDLIAQFEASGRALTQLELATVLSRDKLAELRREQQGAAGSARQLTDQERLLASEVKQLERQLVAQAASHSRLHAGLSQAGLDTRNLAQEQNRLQRELRESAAQTERLGRSLVQGAQGAGGFQGTIGSLTGRLVAMAGTWFGIQTLTTQLMAMFQTGDQAERLSVQLKAVMQAWAKRLSDGIVGLGESIKAFIQTVYAWRDALLVMAQAWYGLKIAGWIVELRGLYGQFVALPVATATAAGGMTTAGTAAAAASIGVQALGMAIKGLLAAVTVESIFQIIRLATALKEWMQAELALRESQALRAQTQAQLNGQLAALSAQLGIAITSVEDMDRAVAEGKVHYDEATGSWRQGAAAVQELGTEAKQTRDYMDEINAVARKTAAEIPATLGKAAETLGLDFERANGRIGESFKETLGALDTLVQHSGSSSAACEEYLAAAFNQAKNKAEIDAVIARMQAMTKQGQLTGDGITRSMAIAAAAMDKVKGGSGDAKTAVAAIGDGFDKAADKGKSATDAMEAGLRRVQVQADKTGTSVAGAGGSGGAGDGGNGGAADGRRQVSRTVSAGSFFYKSVDINNLRGNAEALENTLAGVEDELARYRQKVMDLGAGATSEWSRAYGEIFLKEMKAMRAKLQQELNKAQAKEAEKAQVSQAGSSPAPHSPYINTPSTSVPAAQPLQPIVIQLGERSARIDVAPSQVVGLLDILKRYQEGQT